MRVLPAVLLASALALAPTAAHASSGGFEGRSVDRWDVVYDLQADGSADVTLELDFNFGNDPGHGPYLTLPTAQGYNDEYERIYPISQVSAESPTGAPADVAVEEGDNFVAIRVGDENIGDVDGVQTYIITYTIGGVMNETTADEVGQSGTDAVGDEFYWNAVGDGWTTPISDLTVTVNSPVDVTDFACWAGPQYADTACDSAAADGSTGTFSQASLSPGEPMSVALMYPAGSFVTEPQLRIANDFDRAFQLTPWTVGLAVLLLAGGIALLVRKLSTSAVDHQYAGMIPGLGPVGDGPVQVQKRDYKAPVAVQFEPPKGLRPGQLGTLIDEKADPRDVTATIVDLAVRGYLRIDSAGEDPSKPDYTLVKLREADADVVPYATTLFNALFKDRNQVALEDLKTTFAADMAKVQAEMYRDVTDLGWFRRSPSSARTSWAGAGIMLLIVGVILTFVAANVGWGLVAVPLILLGIMALFTTGNAPARTPEGTRVLMQTKGFETYLTTADANQLKFEEGQDIFSKYLPYAIAFGVADKWSKKFEQLAQQGRALPEPNWFTGYALGTFWLHSSGFGAQMNEFAQMADAAISAPTPSSSGGSGFGGGGGFSGGGGGGGGGGGW